MKTLQPAGWPLPKGYANGVVAEGRFVFLAGMVGWNDREAFETDDFVAQARQALANVATLLAEAGSGPEHLVRLTWFITDKREYLARQKEVGQAYRRVFGRHFPAMSVVVVAGLIEDDALIEIEATAQLD